MTSKKSILKLKMRIPLFLFSTVDAARNCNNSTSQTRTQPTPNPNPTRTDRTQPEPEICWSTRPEPDRVRVGFGFGTRTHTSSSHYLKNQKIKKNKRKFRYWTRLEVSNSYPWQKCFTLYFSLKIYLSSYLFIVSKNFLSNYLTIFLLY